jgi:WD40 repeat protein
MTTGIFRAVSALLIVLLTFAAYSLADPTTVPTSAPSTRPAATQASGDLPAYAIHRFGETPFSPLESGDIDTLDFSPDDRQVLTCGYQPRIWDVASGKLVHAFPHVGIRADHALYLDAKEILVSWDMRPHVQLTVHDIQTGKPIRDLDCDQVGELTEMQLSPDGRHLAIVAQKIELIDVQSGHQVAVLGDPLTATDRLTAISTPRAQFTADSEMLMVIDAKHQARFFDANSGEAEDFHPFDTEHGASLSADGKTVAVLNHDTQVFDVETREEIAVPEPLDQDMKAPGSLGQSHSAFGRFGPGGTLIVALCSPQPRLFEYDTAVRPIARPRCIHERCTYPTGMVFSHNGQLLALLRRGSRPTFLDLRTGKMMPDSTTHQGDITAIEVSPDGRFLASNDAAGSLALWDIATGKRVAFSDGAGPDGIAATSDGLRFSADGRQLFVGASSGLFEIFETDPLHLAHRTMRNSAVASATQTVPANTAVSRDGKMIAQWFGGMKIMVSYADTGKLIQQITPHTARPTLISFSPDGKTLAVPVDTGMNLYTLSTGGVITRRRQGLVNSYLARPRFSPAGDQVVLGDVRGISVWDTTAGTADKGSTPTLSLPTFGTSEVEFDDLGTLLAVSDFPPGTVEPYDYQHPSVSIYDPHSGKLIVRLPSMPAPVEAIRFVPNHPWLLTAGADANITQWDLLSLFASAPLANKTAEQLWNQMAYPDPASAFAAGVELLRRGELLHQTASLNSKLLMSHDARVIQQWIDELASPDSKTREAAHKHLEAAGAAAIPQVRSALAAHPGGEQEDRLTDIAHLIGVDDDQPEQDQRDAQLDRARWAVRFLKWSTDPAAPAEARRLTGAVPATMPSSQPVSDHLPATPNGFNHETPTTQP